MKYPMLEIHLDKLTSNVKTLVNMCHVNHVTIMGVTKVFSGDPVIAKSYLDGGVAYLADSRIQNLKKLQGYVTKKVLLRLPMISEVEDVIRYSDISLNSELDTISKLNEMAGQLKCRHQIILMIDLGDLREGIWPSEFDVTINHIKKLDYIDLIGLGTNLTCLSAVLPTNENLMQLQNLVEYLKDEHDICIEIISGGNSSSIYLLKNGEMPNMINNLRIGEGLVMGTEAAFQQEIDDTFHDIFILKAELIEVKYKPSSPIGTTGLDAFGCKPTIVDKGIRKRGLLAIGKQDVDYTSLIPLDDDITIIGSSSDHLAVDLTDSKISYKTGDVLSFNVKYVGVLNLTTSNYVTRRYVSGGI